MPCSSRHRPDPPLLFLPQMWLQVIDHEDIIFNTFVLKRTLMKYSIVFNMLKDVIQKSETTEHLESDISCTFIPRPLKISLLDP